MYQKWSQADTDYLIQHQDKSDEEVGSVLGRDKNNVKRKRLYLGLLRSVDDEKKIRRAARSKQADAWTPEQEKIIQQHGSDNTSRELKILIDEAGPPRSMEAIQQKRKSFGIIESQQTKRRRLQLAATNIDYEARNERLYSKALNRVKPL
jgi:hypothetical protein